MLILSMRSCQKLPCNCMPRQESFSPYLELCRWPMMSACPAGPVTGFYSCKATRCRSNLLNVLMPEVSWTDVCFQAAHWKRGVMFMSPGKAFYTYALWIRFIQDSEFPPFRMFHKAMEIIGTVAQCGIPSCWVIPFCWLCRGADLLWQSISNTEQ